MIYLARRAIKVIVNADDLGISGAVNTAVFDMMSRRRVTSATILANGPAVDDVAVEARLFAHCSFGVHLNLTQFKPLRPRSALKPLLDADGNFANLASRISWSPPLLSAIARELSAQVESLVDRGVQVSHFDSHHHCHTIPALFPVLKYLQAKFGVRKVRRSWNYYRDGRWPSRALLAKKRAFNTLLSGAYRTTTTGGFSDVSGFIDNARVGGLRCKSFEIMVHPGADEAEDRLVGSAWETDLPYAIEFVSYNDL